MHPVWSVPVAWNFFKTSSHYVNATEKELPYFSLWSTGCVGCISQPTALWYGCWSIMGHRWLQRSMLSGSFAQLEGWAWLGHSVNMMSKWQVIFCYLSTGIGFINPQVGEWKIPHFTTDAIALILPGESSESLKAKLLREQKMRT